MTLNKIKKDMIDDQFIQEIEETRQGVSELFTNTPKKETITSTTGRWWSRILEQLTVSLPDKNGILEERKVLSAPTTDKRMIVFFGSSSTEGAGPPGGKWYGQLLMNKLEPKGYTWYNAGIGGDNTNGAISRFHKDVAPTNPDFVILAFTLGNEGIYDATNKAETFKQFKNNILRLIHMCRQQGAIPIVLTQAPTRLFNSEISNFAKKMNSELEAMGIFCIDWGGVLSELSGMPFESIMTDDYHYNEAAHIEICNAIPPTLFNRIGLQKGGYLNTPKGYLRLGTLTTQIPISYVPEYTITTFSASLRFRREPADTGILSNLLSFNDTDRIVWQNNGTGRIDYVIGNGNGIVTSTDMADGLWHTLTVTYSNISKEVRFYIDGVFVGTYTTSTPISFTRFTVGGRNGSNANLSKTDIKDILLYRTRLTDNQVSQIYEGTIFQTSLEIYSPLHDKTVFPKGTLINLAPTTASLAISNNETAITPVNSTTY